MWNEERLDAMLSAPSAALIGEMNAIQGDIMILGAGGKVGPSLSLMAKRAVEASGGTNRVIAVSRFSDPMVVSLLKENGVEMISADLSDPAQVSALPKVPNVIYMAGRKFGTSGAACQTWAMNVAVPTLVIHHFQAARYVVFSTGNVYAQTPLHRGGSREGDSPEPIGEYAMSSLGRERVFEYAAQVYGAKALIYRLNYAVDLRYGVLCDISNRILSDEPVDVGMPLFNCVWQGYANEVAIRALLRADNPVRYLNVTGPETVSVRATAQRLGELLGKTPTFSGTEGDRALLSNASACIREFGYPQVGVDQMMSWQAEWLTAGGRQLGKPTHFEERKGNF